MIGKCANGNIHDDFRHLSRNMVKFGRWAGTNMAKSNRDLTRNRRATERHPTSRKATFVRVDGRSLLQEGMLTNISRDGMQLRAMQPVEVGRTIDIDVEPRKDDPASRIRARGQVVRVELTKDGDYIIGVRMVASGATKARTVRPRREDPTEPAADASVAQPDDHAHRQLIGQAKAALRSLADRWLRFAGLL